MTRRAPEAGFIAAGTRHEASADLRAPLREALIRHGEYGPGQTAGRFHPGACAALEVTQRCNLDCTLCYLSEAAELAHDPPLELLFRRIDMLAASLGKGANVQITGGDPTLRKVEDLEAVTRRIRARGMNACLMTNGIRAKRSLLKRLAAAGLRDVAFHVDLTEERKGYATERALHPVREDYIERARGLGLRILFNTTVFDGNIDEIPDVARFFRDHARHVTLASFQMQAETGRGVLGQRGGAITQARVQALIEEGFGVGLDFGVAGVGHSACNRYAHALVAGDAATSMLADRRLFEDGVAALEASDHRRDAFLRLTPALARLCLTRPDLALRAARHGARLLWRVRRGVFGGARAARIAILIHNFMDARALDQARCESCVFKVATEDGPLSMCVHNAERDAHLFAPARTPDGWWSAATGETTARPISAAPHLAAAPVKRLKGRERAAALAAHPNRKRGMG